MTWEAVIGLETHVELSTRSKMFCGCPVDFGAPPNTRCCPVCLGLPGALPVPNEAAIEAIVRIGLALGSDVTETSWFHRKNYFYPDLPKNYQISQYDVPICTGGSLVLDTDDGPRTVGIIRVHMEEDTGKNVHMGDGGRIHEATESLIDFNRSGVPLVEIVTQPDIRSADEARIFARELQSLVRSLGVSDARLEEGSLRFDANVSIRRRGAADYGIRTEVKNVNSLRSLHRAIDFEIARQVDLLDSGGEVTQETRHWDEATDRTVPGRGKEEAEDYRYFQEPDLVPILVPAEQVEELRGTLPELPQARRARYVDAGLDHRAARLLVEGEGLADLYDAALTAGAEPRATANWLVGEVVAYLRRTAKELQDTPLTPDHMAELSRLVAANVISATAAKTVLEAVLEGEGSPAEVARERDLEQVSDVAELRGVVAEVIGEHPDAATKIRDGDPKPVGFLVGQVMRRTGGKADPVVVRGVIAELIG